MSTNTDSSDNSFSRRCSDAGHIEPRNRSQRLAKLAGNPSERASRRAVAATGRAYRSDPFDLQAEVLAGFLAALRGLDLDDLDQVPLASRPNWAAYRPGRHWRTPTPTT